MEEMKKKMKTFREISNDIVQSAIGESENDYLRDLEMGKLRSTIRNIGVEELANVIKDALRGSDIKQLKKLL